MRLDVMFSRNIINELYFLYGLIAFLVVSITFILIIDRKESKKKKKSLSDTMNLKVVRDSNNYEKNG